MLRITDIRVALTCPDNINLVVVRVDTNQPGLYGLGCGTYTQRCQAVATAVEEYIKPLLLGRDPRDTQDLWGLCNVNGYWRNGPVVNSALGGVDMALWDIKGKLAGLPVYQLLGGSSREGLRVYRYAAGACKEEVLERAQALWEEGWRFIRCQILPEHCSPDETLWKTRNPKDGFHCDPKEYLRKNVEMLAYIRRHMGFVPELLHDSHERLLPIDAIQFAKELEPLKLFYLEDLFSPEQGEYLRMLRAQCATPIALGELFVNPNDWLGLVKDRLIDFIRIHPGMVGGVTPTVKCVNVCDAFGVRAAFHGPIDMGIVGHLAQMHIARAISNFGVMEWPDWDEGAMAEVFTGMPVFEDGYAYTSERPGFGVEFDEAAAKRYPLKEEIWRWTQYRGQDSGILWP